MLLTAELRLWWPSAPAGLERLFDGQAEQRTDMYLLDPDQEEVGIKLRSDGGEPPRTQIKLLVARLASAGRRPVELWTKANSSCLTLKGLPTVGVHKRRRLLRFRTDSGRAEDLGQSAEGQDPGEGCDVELTEVRRNDDPTRWWTLGFEAYGTLASVERNLSLTLDTVLPRLAPEVITAATCGSYPAWLSGFRGGGR